MTSQPPRITFYWAPMACSTCPHILLQESGLDFTALGNIVNASKVEFVKDFHLINPKKQVPVLVLNGEVITEVPAICTMISSLVPELELMGRTPLEVAKVYEWMCWLSGTVHGAGFRHLFRPEYFTDEEAAIEGIKMKALKTVVAAFETIEEKLDGIFAVGNAFTAVDPYLFVFFRWGIEIGLDVKTKFPKYTALVKNLLERPAVKSTLTFEGTEMRL